MDGERRKDGGIVQYHAGTCNGYSDAIEDRKADKMSKLKTVRIMAALLSIELLGYGGYKSMQGEDE